ncbi:MAG: hypothetical protein ACJ76H_04440 [Bacteriovoracaceae bacterium]
MVTKTRNQNLYSTARELGKRPISRLIVGGVALYYLAPYISRFLQNSTVQDFLGQRVEGIRSRLDGIIPWREDSTETTVH